MPMERKPKIPPIRIPSDACAVWVGRVVIDGEVTEPWEAHFLHKGEWVEIIPYESIGAILRGASQPEAVDLEAKVARLHAVCATVAGRVAAWNWTDIIGDPLPPPYGDPSIIERLSNDEVTWLSGALLASESVGQRKNA